ncbi:MAG: dinitrogenase iron-molybdenum cofactor biosynthesis protein [Phycisphaerae bacterium]|nr:dinitrogenase iron-molybdenum cofactor biosynthesis protein [Phycisphaerae bacterium]
MKIAVTATAPSLDSPLDPRFGRCPYFLLIDSDTLGFQAVENSSQALGQGAGIQAAQLVANQGVMHVLTGHCGPNAHQALTAAGIGVIVGCGGTVRQAVEQFRAGQLQTAGGPDVASHSGMTSPGTGAPAGADPSGSPSPLPNAPAAPGGGPGLGMGRGRGGMGRGMGGGRIGRGGFGRRNCGGKAGGA